MLHIGHLDLFRQMSEKALDVTIGISTAKDNLALRDRTQVITQALSQDNFSSPYTIIPKRQPFELMAEIKMYEPEEVVLFLGQDQYELAKSFEKYAGIPSILIPRKTSSSAVRGMIDAEDWTLLHQHVPMSIYNKVVQLRETEKCLSSN